jgi:hypothetical protein
MNGESVGAAISRQSLSVRLVQQEERGRWRGLMRQRHYLSLNSTSFLYTTPFAFCLNLLETLM